MHDNIPLALHSRVMQLIILPTEKCNFRCTYCYEDFEIGKMKRETIQAIKKLVLARIERNSLDALSFSWFGGEPLLAKEIVLELGEFGNELLEAGRLKDFGGDLTTNGYILTPDVLASLVRLRQTAYQISLDGYGAGHDLTRKYASGKGTFDVIWANLLAAKATSLQFNITLRVHLTRSNGDTVRELVDHIGRQFAGDRRFSVFFKTIENLGGPNSKSVDSVDHQTARQRVSSLEEALRKLGFSVSSVIEGPESATGAGASAGVGTKLTENERAHAPTIAESSKVRPFTGYICYAAKPNSLMIRADGTIGKCTVLMDDPRNKVGRINADGTLTIDSALVNGVWMRGFVSRDAMELGCPAVNLPKLPKEQPIKFAALQKLTESVAHS